MRFLCQETIWARAIASQNLSRDNGETNFSQRGRGVTDRGVTAQKVLRDFQRTLRQLWDNFDTNQEPSGNCSEKLVQMNFFILGGFFRWIFLLWSIWNETTERECFCFSPCPSDKQALGLKLSIGKGNFQTKNPDPPILAVSISLHFSFSHLPCFFVRFKGAEKAHKTFAHKTSSGRPGPVLPVGYPDKKIYVPWVLRIVHKALTPGLPVGRPPRHRRGHRPKRFMLMYLSLSWVVLSFPQILGVTRREKPLLLFGFSLAFLSQKASVGGSGNPKGHARHLHVSRQKSERGRGVTQRGRTSQHFSALSWPFRWRNLIPQTSEIGTAVKGFSRKGFWEQSVASWWHWLRCHISAWDSVFCLELTAHNWAHRARGQKVRANFSKKFA